MEETALQRTLRRNPRCTLRRLPALHAPRTRHRRRGARDLVQAARPCPTLSRTLYSHHARPDVRRGEGAVRHGYALHGELPQRLHRQVRLRAAHHTLQGRGDARDTRCRYQRPVPPQDDAWGVLARPTRSDAHGFAQQEAGAAVPEPPRLRAYG